MDTVPAVAAPEDTLPDGHPVSSPAIDNPKSSNPSPNLSSVDPQPRPPPQQHSYSDQQSNQSFLGGYADSFQPQRAHSFDSSAFNAPSFQPTLQNGYLIHSTPYVQAPPNAQHRYPHTHYQTGASPAAVAYQLSQHIQQQYQGGITPGPTGVPGVVEVPGQVHYPVNLGVTIGYQQSSGTAVVGYDQYGRPCTVTTQASDSAMITAGQPYVQVPYSVGYPQPYLPSPGQPTMWHGSGQQYLPQTGHHHGYGNVQTVNAPSVYAVPQSMYHPYTPPVENQDLQRRHSVPLRQSQRPSYGSNLGPSTYPPAGPRQGKLTYFHPYHEALFTMF